MTKINIPSVASPFLLLLTTTSAQKPIKQTKTNETTTAALPPTQLNNQFCFDLLDVKSKNDDCPYDVLKFISSIPRVGCSDYYHVSRDCCNVTVSQGTYHPECWKYLMNKNASENNDRYMLVMTCEKKPAFVLIKKKRKKGIGISYV
jgi:hypothetical protein